MSAVQWAVAFKKDGRFEHAPMLFTTKAAAEEYAATFRADGIYAATYRYDMPVEDSIPGHEVPF